METLAKLDLITIIIAALCLVSAACNILADWKGRRILVLATKVAASTAFLAIGVLNFDASRFGSFMVAALALSWTGDVLLVRHSKNFFLAGLAAFLLAHAAYATAFANLGIDRSAFVIALMIWLVVVIFLLRWLWKYLGGPYRPAVLVYMAAITVMISFAAATGSLLIAVAAGMFALSDIAVARDRFVGHSITNKVWGIPLYYLAQVLFTISMIRPAS